jgi:hypothetical protein
MRFRWWLFTLLALLTWSATAQDAQPINPLTGLPLTDGAALQRRPILAKISNAPALVRPQAGLGAADLVFEHYVEGGLTRFSAIFYGEVPPRVGSIRSARLIDYELTAAYQAILAFAGASTGVEERIYGSVALEIDDERQAEGKPIWPPSDFAARAYKGIFYGYPTYYRDETVIVPHNLFMTPTALWSLASADGVNPPVTLTPMTFNPIPPAAPQGAATHLLVRYEGTVAEWFYRPERGAYERYSDGLPHYDANTNTPVYAENVVVLYANHTLSDIVESQYQGNNSYGLEIQLWFEGDALVIRDGQAYPVRWLRPTRESQISLVALDGTPFALKPGRTWFQVVRPPEQQNPATEWVQLQ